MPVKILEDVKGKVEEMRPHIIVKGSSPLASNPGILRDMQIVKNIQNRAQSIMSRGPMGILKSSRSSPPLRTKKGGEKGVFVDKPKGFKEKVIVV